MKQLKKKIRIRTTITLITGLHIGGNQENVEIGGIDNSVIKLANSGNQPYIPGSSLKGKMRCLLEQTAGFPKIGFYSEVNNLFGITENKENKETVTRPSKLIVRDSMLTDESAKQLLECENLDMPYTENKFENTINRVDGSANPRQLERVPAGAVFNAEFILNIWDDDNEQEMLKLFEKGISLVENDYIGGSGSRGYGQIKFGERKQEELSEANNWKA